MSNSWVEIACDVPADITDIVAEYLAELSGNGVCVENLNVDAFSHSEIIHAPVMSVRAYFSGTDDIDARMAEIHTFLTDLAGQHPGFVPSEPSVTTVRSEDWSNSWKANFK